MEGQCSQAPPGATESAENLGPTVGQLSEAQLIARFAPLLRPRPVLEPQSGQLQDTAYELLGPGDDCAVVAAPDGRFVISTDTQVQGQDFELVWPSDVESTGFDTGHKCATQNLADAAAMGAVPSSLVVSLTLPRHTPVRWVEDLARGLRAGIEACGAGHCTVVGGDLGGGGEISVTATVTGDLQSRPPVRRGGARPGDLVVLAGTVGRAAAGLDLLRSRDHLPGTVPELDALVAAQLRPVAPVPLGAALAQAGATAMIDVSDGLLRDLRRVAQASGVLVELDPASLRELTEPLAMAGETLGRDPMDWVLGGGEDHGLLSTVPPHVQLPSGVRRLGSVLAEPPNPDGAQALPSGAHGQKTTPERVWIGSTAAHEFSAADGGQGWDHFESQDRFERDRRTPVAGDGRT